MAIKHQKNDGFALLITLIVVSVVVAIGLSVLDLSIKQVRLSTNAKDSEIAFHAANAGMECARFVHRANADAMEIGDSITPSCFGETPITNTRSDVAADPGNGEAFLYQYSFTWGSPDQRCTQITALVASSTSSGSGLTITGMSALVPGYPDSSSKVCAAGERCTVLSVRGYNKPCSSISDYGTIQREVLLQF